MDNNRPYPELESLEDEICGNQCHCFECIHVPTAGSTQTTAADLKESEPEDISKPTLPLDSLDSTGQHWTVSQNPNYSQQGT